MKMSDVFALPMVVDGYSVESQPSTPVGMVGEFVSDIECDNNTDANCVAYAINNHDRLEQENAELREVLEQLVSSSEENEKQLNELLMCNDYGESEALCKARQLLNK